MITLRHEISRRVLVQQTTWLSCTIPSSGPFSAQLWRAEMLSSNALCVVDLMLRGRAAQDATGHHKMARHGEAGLQGTSQLQKLLACLFHRCYCLQCPSLGWLHTAVAMPCKCALAVRATFTSWLAGCAEAGLGSLACSLALTFVEQQPASWLCLHVVVDLRLGMLLL